jgi:hypothetical protein
MSASSPNASAIDVASRRVTLLCPEPLRASACCVEDALIARGWRVRLEFGAQARRVLLRPVRSEGRDLRVLCTSEPLDADVEAQLRLGVDPDGRGDFQIVLFDTPRAVIEAVERMGGATTRRRRLAPRRGRTYLQHATLVEQEVHDDRHRRWGIATAVAVAIAAVAGIEARPRLADPVDAPIVRRAEQDTESATSGSPPIDDPVLAAVRTALPLDDEAEPLIVIDDADTQVDRGRDRGTRRAAAQATEADALEAAPLEAAPLAGSDPGGEITARAAAPRVTVPATPVDLERRRAHRTIDPFASVTSPDDPR